MYEAHELVLDAGSIPAASTNCNSDLATIDIIVVMLGSNSVVGERQVSGASRFRQYHVVLADMPIADYR